MTAALIIFTLTFVGVSVTRLPWVKIDRPAAAFTGAIAMVLFGVFTFPAAVQAIDWDTIALLLGMMVVIGALQADGYTGDFAAAIFGRARSATGLLIIVVVFTGVASAFLVNDAVVLVTTPLIIAYCRDKGLNPIPFLLAEAMASNIGSAATITGNPQNVLIGLRSGIPFGRFLLLLLPVSIFSSVVLLLITRRMYRADLSKTFQAQPNVSVDGPRARMRVRPSLIILALVVTGFVLSPWLGIELPLIALVGAGIVLVAGGHSPRDIFRRVDWVLLLFFAGLFIVIGGVVQEGIFDGIVNRVDLRNDLAGIALLHGVSLVLAQLISNVPLTILLLPVMEHHAGDLLWLSLASAATLAGNLTLIGAVANLIVAEGAAGLGVRISFWQFIRLGVPVTAVTLVLGTLVLWVEHVLGLV